MKHTKIFLFLFLISVAANAQFKNEISLGYGNGGTRRVLYGNQKEMLIAPHRRVDSLVALRVLETSNFIQLGTLETGGVYSLKYARRINGWISVGLTATMVKQEASVLNKDYNKMGARIGELSRTAWCLAPEVNIIYHAGRLVHIYATAGLGVSMAFEKLTSDLTGKEEKRNTTFTNFQISPFGIKVGKRLSGYLEAGYGYKGVVNLGLAYGF